VSEPTRDAEDRGGEGEYSAAQAADAGPPTSEPATAPSTADEATDATAAAPEAAAAGDEAATDAAVLAAAEDHATALLDAATSRPDAPTTDGDAVRAGAPGSTGNGEVLAAGLGRFELITVEDFARRSQPLSDRRGDPDDDRVPGWAGAEPGARPRRPRAEAHPSRADLRRRALARAIDVAIFALLSESVTYVGPLVALIYLLLGDGLFDGASVGKRLARLRVVRGSDGRPASVFDSLLRNAPLGIAGLFVLIPLVGWALFLTLGLLVVLFEGYLVFNDPRGVRAGDVLAGTQVRDATALPGASVAGSPPATAQR
jgi:uncharacterized RDD family membrane protein YckC